MTSIGSMVETVVGVVFASLLSSYIFSLGTIVFHHVDKNGVLARQCSLSISSLIESEYEYPSLSPVHTTALRN